MVAREWDDADAVATLKYSELPGFKGIKLFTCHRLAASMTPGSCAKSFVDAKCLACVGCPVGPVHLAANPVSPKSLDRYEKAQKDAARWDAMKGLACVRCERTGSTATSHVGKFRIVKSLGLCVGCANRQYEVAKGKNSKNSAPVKWAHIREAGITIEKGGERKTIDIGPRTGWAECGRFVAQAYEGWTLLATIFDDDVIPQFSLWNPLPFSPWEPRAPKLVHTKPLPLEEDGDEWSDPDYRPDWFRAKSSDISAADGNGTARRNGWLPPLSEEEDAAYRASFDAPRKLPSASEFGRWKDDRGIVWNNIDAGVTAESVRRRVSLIEDYGLDDLVAFITDGWPESLPSEARATPTPAGEICAVDPTTIHEAVAQRLENGESIGAIALDMGMPYHVADRIAGEIIEALENAPTEPLEPVAGLVTLPEIAELAVEPVREPQLSPKLLAKRHAREAREARKGNAAERSSRLRVAPTLGANKQRAKPAAKPANDAKRDAQLPGTHAKLVAVVALANALSYSISLT
jgi:hypothetical protein